MIKHKHLSLCLALICTTQCFAESAIVNGIYYEFHGDRATVARNGDATSYSVDPIYSGDVIIPSTVTYNGHTYTVTKIGMHAFAGSYELTSVSLPSTIDTVEGQAFTYMSLDSLVIPASVKYIGSNVVRDLSKRIGENELASSCLKKLVLNCDSVVLGSYLWGNVLGGWGYDPSTNDWKLYDCEVIWNVRWCKTQEEYAHIMDYGGGNVSKFIIGDKVDSIPSYLTWNNGSMNMHTLIVGKNVTKIGSGAFAGCGHVKTLSWNAKKIESESEVNYGLDSVENLILGNEVEQLPSNFFYGHKLLKNVNFPASLKRIESNAFSDCYNLTSFEIPQNLEYLGDRAFAMYTKKYNKVSTLNVPASLTYFGKGALDGCVMKNLIWNAIECVDWSEFGELFGDSIQNVILGDGVKAIPANFLFENQKITAVEFPSTIEKIGNNAFYACHNIGQITCNAMAAPKIGAKTLQNINTKANTPIYIPCCSFNSYKTADYWSSLGVLTEPSSEFKLELSSNNKEYGTIEIEQNISCCNDIAIFEAKPFDGYKFSKWDDGNTSNPRVVNISKDEIFIAIFEAIGYAVNDVKLNSKNFIKLMYDGRLYVSRNGNLYNALGGKVK